VPRSSINTMIILTTIIFFC